MEIYCMFSPNAKSMERLPGDIINCLYQCIKKEKEYNTKPTVREHSSIQHSEFTSNYRKKSYEVKIYCLLQVKKFSWFII